MTVSGYSYLSLLCLDRFKGERSFSAIFHLLRGKKTSQTLQDIQLFSLSNFFSLFPQISRETVEEACKHLESQNYIDREGKLTAEGGNVLSSLKKDMPMPLHLDSWKHGKEARKAWEKLSLLVQTATHFADGKNRFLPVTSNEEAQKWVKGCLKQAEWSRSGLAQNVFRDLHKFLSDQPDWMSELFVFRLTSPGRAGLTYLQLEERLDRDAVYLEVCFWSMMHQLLEQSAEYEFSVLSNLKNGNTDSLPLTQSARQTYRLLMQGMDRESAGKVRNLKQSTIEDHIVEIAMHDHRFDFSPYFLPEEKEEIIQAIHVLQTRQLKKIKEYLDHKYTYFQIRLGMAAARR
ncbi:helix-turn-helix domain-containing protein [Metabacillus sp. 84]|uniref:helix-turn-helix domain-containing protein n=1 Tax=unclassified Metabacillus TaxID=2675274 RepID=UPI003CF7DAD2